MMRKILLILLYLPMIGFGQGWERTFGDIDKTENGYAVQQTTDGGYIITGSTYSFGNEDVYLIKTDGNGQEFNIPVNPNKELEKVINVLGRKTKEKTNEPLIYILDDGTVEKRIVIE